MIRHLRTAPPGRNLHVSSSETNSKTANFSLRRLTLRFLTAWLRSLFEDSSAEQKSAHKHL
ncbi:hypothetical protein B8W98_03285 [Lentilactobacillus parakefiri]|uniref:Uncharacterized protein n=1 Tax=Lentilactobacillus parakefiri TaxID=152332 RepID=A0A269YLT4_9LACO|nr:hypothetical protein B8W98_03285 [Lentilactobacillus parakefiri]